VSVVVLSLVNDLTKNRRTRWRQFCRWPLAAAPMERSDYLPTARLHELAAQVDPKIRLEADAEQARRCSRPLPDTAHAHPVCASGNRWEPACGFKFAEKPAGGISRWLPDAPECVRAAPFGPGTLFRRRK